MTGLVVLVAAGCVVLVVSTVIDRRARQWADEEARARRAVARIARDHQTDTDEEWMR